MVRCLESGHGRRHGQGGELGDRLIVRSDVVGALLDLRYVFIKLCVGMALRLRAVSEFTELPVGGEGDVAADEAFVLEVVDDKLAHIFDAAGDFWEPGAVVISL